MQLVDFITSSVDLPKICHLDHVLYVDKKFYNKDLAVEGALCTKEKCLKQLTKDIHRCEFKYDGEFQIRVPKELPADMLPYCTQAVLGLPVSLVSDEYSVLERTPCERMKVEVWAGTHVLVTKGLALASDNLLQNFDITIKYSCDEDRVQIVFSADHLLTHASN